MKRGILFIGLLLLCSFVAYKQEGIASYYHNKFQGNRTASGERYHKDSLTAAHKTLPFGTFIKVTNLKNDSTVVLKVNDRIGTSKRIIDVSYAGATQLNFIRQGITKVKIETISTETESIEQTE
ncbi:MAG: septal ring lytic transglycosylase RlpA family protein [Bacteroidetes bacterium]|nr:septal ring lytic transglycosylase RlpA family protein [Bacteroidota bacterium]